MDINERLREAIKNAIPILYENLTVLAKAAEVSQGSLNLFMNGKRDSMQWDTAWKILDKLGYSFVSPKEEDPYEYIPRVAAEAGAGSSLIVSNEVIDLHAFRRDFLHTKHINPKSAVLMSVLGDSMEPLFREQDYILVDESVQILRDGEIFLVGLGEELLVKRVQRALRGWILQSENKRFSDIAVEGVDLEQFRVYGKVKWFGRLL